MNKFGILLSVEAAYGFTLIMALRSNYHAKGWLVGACAVLTAGVLIAIFAPP